MPFFHILYGFEGRVGDGSLLPLRHIEAAIVIATLEVHFHVAVHTLRFLDHLVEDVRLGAELLHDVVGGAHSQGEGVRQVPELRSATFVAAGVHGTIIRDGIDVRVLVGGGNVAHLCHAFREDAEHLPVLHDECLSKIFHDASFLIVRPSGRVGRNLKCRVFSVLPESRGSHPLFFFSKWHGKLTSRGRKKKVDALRQIHLFFFPGYIMKF